MFKKNEQIIKLEERLKTLEEDKIIIEDTISRLEYSLLNEYNKLYEEKGIKIGDKVKIVKVLSENPKNEIGIFKGFEFKYDIVKPRVCFIKKDGTAYKNKTFFIWNNWYIEKIDNKIKVVCKK